MKDRFLKYIFILSILFCLNNANSEKIIQSKKEEKVNFLKGFSFCGVDKMNIKIRKKNFYSSEEIKIIKKRRLDNELYKPIRIFLDTTNINSQGENNPNLQNKISKAILAMEKCIKTLEKLLKVIPLKYNISLNQEELSEYDIEKINPTLQKEGISADLIIFPRIGIESEFYDSTLANAMAINIDRATYRPIVGIVNINPNIDFSLGNSNKYLESILLHEFTHILGFASSLFYYYPGKSKETLFFREDKRLGLNKTYIKTKKLIETAKKYFNCDRIDGIELENQGGSGTVGSHWETRILLGDYMNGNIFPMEQVISEFTLAVLEDSGWYKVNYYTGGLMRYGKHQGCDFIEKDCLNSSNLKTQFKNDFFNINNKYKSSCSSGRQSRGYNLLYIINSIENEIYSRFDKNYGYASADYCPIPIEYRIESNNSYYIGNCQNGNYKYASAINFGRTNGYSNEEIPKNLGEKYEQNSFCSLTSVIPKTSNNIYQKYKSIHAACYPMFCSERSLTIQINEQFIVCPRQGGKISISENYEGNIYCPDYNLICTGKVMCNDMIDCVEKESLIKNDTYEYDYEINTSLDYSEIETSDVLIGYELSDDGKCPINCAQCLINKKCFQCLDGYKLIGKKENDLEPIICSKDIDISNGYYQVGNIYYECFENCVKCSSGNKCDKCAKNKKLNSLKNKCVDAVNNCELYDENDNCLICQKNYAFIEDDRTQCIEINNKTLIDISEYFTDDNGVSYFPCSKYIKNCRKCSKRNECEICISDYVFLDNNKTVCINKEELEGNNIAYRIDDYNYKSCSKAINNCISCKSEDFCLSCDKEYGIINDKFNECQLIFGNEKKYYFNQSNGIYYSCNKSKSHCEECSDENNCTLCEKEYDLDPYYKCVNESLLSDNFKYSDNQIKNCSDAISNCIFCYSEDLCNYCKYNYSFANNKRNECISQNEFKNNNNYYTLDNGINYYSCNFEQNGKGIRNCSECKIENEKLECTKCMNLFAFLDNDFQYCYNIISELDEKIKEKTIYKDNDGINYYTCEKEIENCSKCENQNQCLECLEGNAFLDDNFTICYTKKKFEIGYFSNEDETIYYSCIDNCEICNNTNTCIKCISNYAFIGKDRTKCVNIKDNAIFNINQYYTEDEGISYFPCDTLIENCYECSKKDECNKCKSEYIILDNNKSICLDKQEFDNNKKAYKFDEYNYKSCYKAIDNCITCNSENYCLSCDSGYGIINDMHSKCELLFDKDKKLFYNEENGVYYYCNKSLNYCEECLDKDNCILCYENYILPFNESKCIDINENQVYYFYDENVTNYKRCNYGVNNCLKCLSEDICIECENSYTLLNNNTEKCELKSLYENNNEYITLDNGINYYNCDILIGNCSKCKLNSEKNVANCINCNNNFALLDNDLLKCYNIEEELIELIINKEIYSNDNGINYYFCNKAIDNCYNCEDENNCILCSYEFALYEEDNKNCYFKSKFNIGYFSDENETRYYSCLPNCDKCENKEICQKCSSKYMPNENSTECLEKIVDINELKEKCIINIKNISDEDFELILSNNITLNDFILDYQEESIDNVYYLNLFTNQKNNFSMSIFKYSECSIFLLEKGNQKLSTDNIIVNMGNSLNNNQVYIQAFVKYTNKIFYSLYNSITLEKVNIKENCLNCNEYRILNNYTNSITNYLGKNALFLIQKENIDLFDKGESIFNDICQNLTINNFDYPLEQRKSKFYLGNEDNKKIILCGDANCNLIKDNKNNSTSLCSCPIDDNFNINDIFFIESNKIIFENNISNTTEKNNYLNILYIFKCTLNSFKLNNIKNNIGFYISISIVGAQIISYLCLSCFSFSGPFAKLPLSPPKRDINMNYKEGNQKNEESNGKIDNHSNNTSISEKQIENNNNRDNLKKKFDEKKGIMDFELKMVENTEQRILNKSSKNIKGKIEYDLILDYISFKNAKKQDKRSFCYYYCHLLFYNQLLLNLFSCCSCSIAESFIPFPLKLIKILFLYLINLFINAVLITDNYIIKKYNYFNEKYDIENNEINSIIKEKIFFSINNGKINILISFCICLFLQYILGCILNIRRKIANILINQLKNEKNINKNKNIKEIKYRMSCMINSFFIICLLLMIAIFLNLTNYFVVYRGIFIDIFSQSIMSFIILQICPFIICFFVSFFWYIGLKGNCQLLFLINKCLSGL